MFYMTMVLQLVFKFEQSCIEKVLIAAIAFMSCVKWLLCCKCSSITVKAFTKPFVCFFRFLFELINIEIKICVYYSSAANPLATDER